MEHLSGPFLFSPEVKHAPMTHQVGSDLFFNVRKYFFLVKPRFSDYFFACMGSVHAMLYRLFYIFFLCNLNAKIDRVFQRLECKNYS